MSARRGSGLPNPGRGNSRGGSGIGPVHTSSTRAINRQVPYATQPTQVQQQRARRVANHRDAVPSSEESSSSELDSSLSPEPMDVDPVPDTRRNMNLPPGTTEPPSNQAGSGPNSSSSRRYGDVTDSDIRDSSEDIDMAPSDHSSTRRANSPITEYRRHLMRIQEQNAHMRDNNNDSSVNDLESSDSSTLEILTELFRPLSASDAPVMTADGYDASREGSPYARIPARDVAGGSTRGGTRGGTRDVDRRGGPSNQA